MADAGWKVEDVGPDLFDRGDLYRAYWDASVDALFAIEVTPQGGFRCAGFNAALASATGLDPRQTRGKAPEEYLDARAAEGLTRIYRECVEAGEPITRSLILPAPDGLKVFDVSVLPVRGRGARIELLLGRAHDITEMRATESAPGLLRDVLAALSTHLAVLDREGRIVLVNDAWRTFDRTRAAGDCEVGANYLDSCAWSDGSRDAAMMLEGLQRVRDGRSRTFTYVYRFDPTSIYQMRVTRFDRGSELWIVVTHDDVTAAYEARAQVSNLTERLLDIQEEERQRISLELHDSTSQHLVAVQLGLGMLVKGGRTDQVLADIHEELMEAHREIRTLSYLLHPPRLAAEHLETTLRQFVDGFRRRTGAAIDLVLEGEVDEMPFRVQRAVFRVVQEALANAHKHANARRIRVELSRQKDGLRVGITDDGRTPELPIVPGLGLPGMEARIERFGGTLAVTPSSSGTTVSAFVPADALRPEADEKGA
jgi:signal transduction histidine kinase